MMRRRTCDERGSSALEMAIVAPSFIIFIFAIVEVALWMHARDVAMAAAREGVAQMRTVTPRDRTGDLESDIEAFTEAKASQLGSVQDPQAIATYDEDEYLVTVTVEGGVIDLVPGLDLTVTGEASGLLEDFQPDLGPP